MINFFHLPRFFLKSGFLCSNHDLWPKHFFKRSPFLLFAVVFFISGCVVQPVANQSSESVNPAESKPMVSPIATEKSEPLTERDKEISLKEQSIFQYLLGNILLDNHNWDEAEEAFSQVSLTDSTFVESRMLVAHLATQRGDLDKAIRYANEVIKIEPNQGKARILLASILAARKEYPEAALHYQELLKYQSDNPRARLHLAQIYGFMGTPDKANSVLEPLFKNAEFAWNAYLASGRAYINANKVEKSIEPFKKSMQLAPDRLEPILALGGAYQQIHQPKKAEEVYRAYLRKHPAETAIHNRLGLLLLDQDNQNGALAEFRKITELIPNSVQAYLTTALILFSQERHDEALKDLRLAQAQEPDNSTVLYYLGQVLEAMDRIKEAKEQYASITDSDPFHMEAQMRLAFLESELGENEEAITRLKKLSGQNPERTDLLLALSVLMLKAKDYNGVVDVATRGLGLSPDQNRFLFNRAMALDKLSRWPEAEKDLQNFLKLNPNDAPALNYLGYTWAERNEKLDEAYKLLLRAAQLAPGDGFITDSLGWILYRMNRLDESLNTMREAVRMEPKDPTICEHLGDVLFALGQHKEAISTWRHALELDKTNSSLEKKIQQNSPPQ
ncbi:MAG: tetratricopeptide repeat protein [Magnetococcus sp. DMHC-6]